MGRKPSSIANLIKTVGKPMKSCIGLILLFFSLPTLALNLGQGHYRENWTPKCVEGQLNYSGIAEGKLEVNHSYKSSEELVHALARAKASFDLFLFGGEGEIKIDSLIKKGRKHWYFVSEFETKDRSEVLVNPQWTNFGLEVLKLNNPETFKSLCGNEYVSQLTRKKRIYVVFQYNFKVAQARSDVTAKIKVKTFFGSVSKTHRTTIEVGAPIESVKIFFIGEGVDLNPYALEMKNLMNLCNETNIGACDSAASNFINLISNVEFLNSLTQQLGVPTDFIFKDYSQLKNPFMENNDAL